MMHEMHETMRKFGQVLAPWSKDINLNANVMAMYLEHLLPGITQPGDDNNHGSAAMYDVLCLQVRLPLDAPICLAQMSKHYI